MRLCFESSRTYIKMPACMIVWDDANIIPEHNGCNYQSNHTCVYVIYIRGCITCTCNACTIINAIPHRAGTIWLFSVHVTRMVNARTVRALYCMIAQWRPAAGLGIICDSCWWVCSYHGYPGRDSQTCNFVDIKRVEAAFCPCVYIYLQPTATS
jgi:hypothetical protein